MSIVNCKCNGTNGVRGKFECSPFDETRKEPLPKMVLPLGTPAKTQT
jgi:hypothetical protein